MFTFQIVTFGCKVSQYESQAIREYWTSLGGRETEQRPHVVLLATCAVTAQAVSDARQMARKWAGTGARVIVTGCAATAAPHDFATAQAVIPQRDKAALLRHHPLTGTDITDDRDGVINSTEGMSRNTPGFPPFHINGFSRARPVLKVQDGCSHRCTYCIVPLTRGPTRSRAPGEVIAEAHRLLASGHREIMVSGINLRQYRKEGKNFWALLRQLHEALAPEWRNTARLRLSSLEPAQLDAEGLDTLEACPMVCPHVHLSLQSGSPAVLRRMGREHYAPEAVWDAVSALRRFWPIFGLGADILMGFPGESEAEAEETVRMASLLPLTYAHVFPWSSRPGTRAADMPEHLPKAVRQEHAARVRRVVEEKQAAFLLAQSQLSGFQVALDGTHARQGINEYYAPCLMPEGHISTGHALLSVRPVGVEAGKVAVLASNSDLS